MSVRQAPPSVETALEGVPKTALLTLRARADEHRRPEGWLEDPLAAAWSERLAWPAELERWYSPFAQVKTALRVKQIDRVVEGLLASGRTIVVELGCGYSTRSRRLKAHGARWIHLDLESIIASRDMLGAADPEAWPGSVLDPSWARRFSGRGEELVLIAEGLWYYLPEDEVRALWATLRKELVGAAVVFDVIGVQDIGPARRSSRAAGAPILWAVKPPLEGVFEAWGLEPAPSEPPGRLLEELIEGFEDRYGRLMGWVLRLLAKIPILSGRRSGLVVGILRAQR